METLRPPIPESKKTLSMSVEDAQKLLEEKRPFPKDAIRNFGPSVKDLEDILHDPEISELDMIWLSGQMTTEELDEYALLFPEVKETKNKLRTYADNLYKKIAPTIPKIVRGMFTKDKQQIRSLKPLENLMNTILTLIRSQELPTTIPNHRSFQLETLEANLLEKCSLALFNHTAEQYGHLQSFQILQSLSLLQKRDRDMLTSDKKPKEFSGAKVIRYKIAGKTTLQSHKQTAQEIFDALPPESEDIANPKNFDIIEDLSHIKKIESTRMETTNGLILFHNNRRKNTVSIATVVLCFDKSRIRMKEGVEKLPLDECLVFNFDRSSGELLIAGTQQTGKIILGEKRYQSLKNFIYKRLLQDLGDAEFKDEEEDEETLEEENPQEPISTSEILQKMEETILTETTNKTKAEKRMENFHFGNLRSTKGTQILRALRNILGEEIRVNGSHHIFEGKTGATVPIPFHGDIPIGIGLLKKCLKKLGVTPQELYQNI